MQVGKIVAILGAVALLGWAVWFGIQARKEHLQEASYATSAPLPHRLCAVSFAKRYGAFMEYKALVRHCKDRSTCLETLRQMHAYARKCDANASVLQRIESLKTRVEQTPLPRTRDEWLLRHNAIIELLL